MRGRNTSPYKDVHILHAMVTTRETGPPAVINKTVKQLLLRCAFTCRTDVLLAFLMHSNAAKRPFLFPFLYFLVLHFQVPRKWQLPSYKQCNNVAAYVACNKTRGFSTEVDPEKAGGGVTLSHFPAFFSVSLFPSPPLSSFSFPLPPWGSYHCLLIS